MKEKMETYLYYFLRSGYTQVQPEDAEKMSEVLDTAGINYSRDYYVCDDLFMYEWRKEND